MARPGPGDRLGAHWKYWVGERRVGREAHRAEQLDRAVEHARLQAARHDLDRRDVDARRFDFMQGNRNSS